MTDVDTPDPLAEAAPLALEHLNEDHSDAVLLVARHLAGRVDAHRATAVALDRHGLDIAVEGDGGPAVVRVAFPAPVGDLRELQQVAIELMAAARERSGSDELSSLERQLAEVRTVPTLITTVVRAEQLTGSMRQVTVGGGDLSRFEPLGPDQFVYVLAPPPGRSELTIDAGFSWEQHEQMPEAERPVGAYYTVRRWRPEELEIDLVVVLHGEGEGAAWGRRAAPGDPVALWGPRQAFEPPVTTEAYLLVADETGLPAVAAILETLPDEVPVTAVLEVPDDAECLPLRERPGVEVTWLYRNGAPAGTTSLLLDAVTSLDLRVEGLYAWGGAESRCITRVRRHLRHDVGLGHAAVSMTGYWRLER